MSINWNFNAQEAVTEEFAPIPVGDHRVRIAEVTQKQSSKGNDMLEFVLDVSGHNGRLWHYIVFMPENTQMTNQKLGQLFDSFELQPNCLQNLQSMVGRVGAARVKHEMYNGESQAKVHYLVSRAKQAELPPWQEPSRTSITHGGATPTPVAQPQQAMPAPGANGFTQMPQNFKAPWEQ